MHRCVSIMSSAVSIFCFVDLVPFCCLFMCPLSVAGHEVGRYFSTASAVRPGHVASWLFLIAFNRVAEALNYCFCSCIFYWCG